MSDAPSDINPAEGRWFTYEEFQAAMMEQAMVGLVKFWSEIQQVPEAAWREFGREFILEMIRESGNAAGVIIGIRRGDRLMGGKTDLDWMFPNGAPSEEPTDPRPARRQKPKEQVQ